MGLGRAKHLEVVVFFEPGIDPTIEYGSSAVPEKNKNSPDLDIHLANQGSSEMFCHLL